MLKGFFRVFLKHIIIILLLLSLIAFLYTFKIPCFFRFMTGIPCPSCGMTRAFLSLLHLDFSASFAYHPLLIPALITIFIAIHMNVGIFHFNKKICNIYFLTFAAVFFIIYFFRLTTGTIV